MDNIFVRQRGSRRVESINIRSFEAQDAETCFKIGSAAFIQKVGFIPAGDVYCNFPDMQVPALRLEKKLIS